jgi:hypothetical protein
MIRIEPRTAEAVKTIVRNAGGALALVAVMLCAPGAAHAFKWYDNGSGSGCVTCHTGFVNGIGPLHLQHRNKFEITNCNVCHPNGGGTKPVLTYSSGAGGGYGCAGCHGQDYGETSPNSGLPKASSYGLREFHVAKGVTSCGTSGCHQPGALGHSNPFPTLFGEDVAPPYFQPMFSGLTDPCSSSEEDQAFDPDGVGLDNDGDGAVDYPADSDCPVPPTPTPTPTATPLACGAAPALGCIASGKGSLQVDEKTVAKAKLNVTLGKLQVPVTQGQFGDPVNGTTAYAVCVYDAANQLKGEYLLEQAGATCDDAPCWKAVSDKGYAYKDKAATADGIQQAKLSAGDAGKGKVAIKGKNSSGHLPTGLAALLQYQTSATVQVLSSNAACFGIGLTEIKKADGLVFKASGP